MAEIVLPAKTGASLNRGKSKQDYGTPPEFLEAVRLRFGPISFDLAATIENSVCGEWFYGPTQDSLAQDWALHDGLLWLNPPFANIAPWAEKSAACRHRRGWLLLLTPASIGTDWFAEHVKDNAIVLGLSPRLTFVGTTDPYPKDLMLSCFGFGMSGFDTWRWAP